MCVSVFVYVSVLIFPLIWEPTQARRGTSGSLKMELQVGVSLLKWVLRTEFWSSAGAADTLITE